MNAFLNSKCQLNTVISVDLKWVIRKVYYEFISQMPMLNSDKMDYFFDFKITTLL